MPEEQVKGAVHPTLFIGLGGTGKEILFRLRRKFYDRWGETGLPCTSYLWIDTDSRDVLAHGEKIDEIDLEVRFREHEKVPLLEGQVGQGLGEVLKDRSGFKHIHSWLFTDEVQRFGVQIADGAGGVRTIGRLTFFDRFSRIEAALKQNLDNITDLPTINRTREKYLAGVEFETTPRAFVIYSVAGGTGSGIFLDLAFLLRKLGMKTITGMLLLPNIFYQVVNDETSRRSYGNAYAALKELDHFMRRVKTRVAEGDDTGVSVDFDVAWSGKEETIQGPPFTVNYVCEMRNQKNIGAGSRTELFHMLAESLFLDFLPGPFSTQKRSAFSNVLTLMSGLDDDVSPVEGLTLHFSRRYATRGMSKVEVPLEAIREACSCQLASELTTYWHRSPENPDLKDALRQTTQERFGVEGLKKHFGEDWKKKIEAEIPRQFEDLPAHTGDSPTPLEQHVSSLPEKLRSFLQGLVGKTGPDPKRWGNIAAMIPNSTAKVTEQVRKELREWIKECMEEGTLGPRSLAGDNCMLAILSEWLRKFYRGEVTELKKQLDQEASTYQQRAVVAILDMEFSVKKWFMMPFRQWTLDTMYARLKEAAEQAAKATAEAFLVEEAAKVATAADAFLAEENDRLLEFVDALPAMASYFTGLRGRHLEQSEKHLSISIFDEAEDYSRFYKLDFDDLSGKHHEVHPPSEHRRFLLEVLGSGQKLYDLREKIRLEGGDWIQQTLRVYATKRFQADFDACRQDPKKHRDCGRFVEVLEHPKWKNAGPDKYDKLVNAALPMLRKGMYFAGSKGPSEERVFIGVPATDREPYLTFLKKVKEQLAGKEISGQVYPQVTDDPTCVRVVIESYAFSLPKADLIVRDCHDKYYDFYQTLHKSEGDHRTNVPLHLCANWEGEFEDIRPLEAEKRPDLLEALKVLSLGPALGVIQVIPKGNRREYAYHSWVAPASQRHDLGNKREALEFLKRQKSTRQRLLDQVNARHSKLKSAVGGADSAALHYFWILSYLNFKLFHRGTPENKIVEERIVDLDTQFRAKHITMDDLSEKTAQERIEFSRSKANEGAKWEGDMPALKALKLWVDGKEEAAAGTQ